MDNQKKGQVVQKTKEKQQMAQRTRTMSKYDKEQIQQRRNTMDKQKKDKRTNIKQDKEDNGQCT